MSYQVKPLMKNQSRSHRRVFSQKEPQITKKRRKHKKIAKSKKLQAKQESTENQFQYSLVSLKGQPIYRAPLWYQNQIFQDVFDQEGNHDKFLENTKSFQIYKDFSSLKKKYLLVTRDEKAVSPHEYPEFSGFYQTVDTTVDIFKPLGVKRNLYSRKPLKFFVNK